MNKKQLKSFSLVLFAFTLFVVLPIVKLDITLDHELAMRFLISSIMLAVIYLVYLFQPPDDQVSNKKFRQFAFLLLFSVAWMLLSSYRSINLGDALWECIRVSILFLFAVTCFIFLRNKEKALQVLGKFSLLALIIFTFYGIIQLIPVFQQAISKNQTPEINLWISSSLGNKNFFAEVMVMLIPLFAINFYLSKTKRRIVFGLALICTLAWILLLQSFASWLALVVAALVIVIYRSTTNERIVAASGKPNRWKRIFLSIIIPACLLIAFFMFSGILKNSSVHKKSDVFLSYIRNPALLDSTSSFNDNSIFERILIWRNSVILIEDHPLLGAGLNNWKVLQAQYGIGGTAFINSGMINYEHPHNDYLLILAEQGPVGLFLYVAFFLFILSSIYKSLRKTTNPELRTILLCLAFGFLSFSVMSFFAYPRSRYYVMLVLMLYAGLTMIYVQDESKEIKSEKKLIRIIYFLYFLLSIAGIFAASYRLNGEIHTREMLRAQYAKNFAKMSREAMKAQSFFYPLDQTNTPFEWYLGMAHFYSGNVNEAIRHYEMAVEMNPYHLRILNDLGTSYEQTGQREKAIEQYRRGLKVAPLFTEGLLNLSATYYNGGQTDSAFAVIDRIQKMKISGRETQNYTLFLKAILLAKAIKHIENIKPETEKVRCSVLIEQDLDLSGIYNEAKISHISFLNALDSSLLR